jgi:hypothetical protein
MLYQQTQGRSTEAVLQFFHRPVDSEGRRLYTDEAYERIARAAPPHPPCFESQPLWVEWLALAGASGDRQLRPLADGRFNAGIRYCRDCTKGEFRQKMLAAGRCKPDWLKRA